MDRVSGVVERAVETGVTAGAVALVRHGGEVVLQAAFGQAAIEPEPRPMRVDTVFDLASLTKPLAGAAVALALVDRGVFSLDEEVTAFLPELKRLAGEGVTFRRLLSHTSGLPGWRPLYTSARGRGGLLAVVEGLGLAAGPGNRFEYSDIGFLTLGLALERAGGQALDDLAARLVFEPLGLTSTGYHPSAPPDTFAVTERGNAFERRMAEWAGLDFADWRTDFHAGVVNDGNAHYGLGGVSAHAGLFSTAYDLGVLGEMWRGGGEWQGERVLSGAVVEQATTDQTTNGSGRGLGWQLMSRTGPNLAELSRADAGFFPPARSPWTPRPSGELLSPYAFGHTGFTGTSIWIDPARELVAVLLTNATHPEVDIDKPVNALRARYHNAVVASLDTDPGRYP
jgi:CubicO group peptidase (beta-lactamase class C family)